MHFLFFLRTQNSDLGTYSQWQMATSFSTLNYGLHLPETVVGPEYFLALCEILISSASLFSAGFGKLVHFNIFR